MYVGTYTHGAYTYLDNFWHSNLQSIIVPLYRSGNRLRSVKKMHRVTLVCTPLLYMALIQCFLLHPFACNLGSIATPRECLNAKFCGFFWERATAFIYFSKAICDQIYFPLCSYIHCFLPLPLLSTSVPFCHC